MQTIHAQRCVDNFRDHRSIVLCLLLLAYCVLTILCRIFVHPLRKIPGPKLAAATKWFEAYHDIIKGGTFIKNYPQWHQKYGPVIRIGPNHVHVKELRFYDEIFGLRSTYRKDPTHYRAIGTEKSLAAMLDPERHRQRRNVLNPIFSKRIIASKQSLVLEKVFKAVKYIERRSNEDLPVDMELLFRRISMDVISQTLFGFSFDLTDSDEEMPPPLKMLADFIGDTGLIKHFPVLKTLSKILPRFVEKAALEGFLWFKKQCAEKIEVVIKTRQEKQTIGSIDFTKLTIFDVLLRPNEEKGFKTPRFDELIDDAHLFLVAGTVSTSHTLACGIYYLLTSPKALQVLQTELRDSCRGKGTGKYSWKTISKLPYLSAVVKEILRKSTAIPGNLPRIVPPEGINICDYFIPGGTTISMSNRMVHFDPEIFPDPEYFRPERWLGQPRRFLEKWNVSFTRGPRRCIGMNLAYIELYTSLAVLINEFFFELFDTGEASMEWLDKGVATNRNTVKVRAQSRQKRD